MNSCVEVVVQDRDSSLVVAPDCGFRRRGGEVGAVGSRKKVRGLGEGKLDGLPWEREEFEEPFSELSKRSCLSCLVPSNNM